MNIPIQISWKELKEKYWSLVWVIPGIVISHELSHIFIGKGLRTNYGLFGFTIHRQPGAIFGNIGVFVKEGTPWVFAAGLIGSLIWLVIMKRYSKMTRQTFWLGIIYSVWIAKWDLKWLIDFLFIR